MEKVLFLAATEPDGGLARGALEVLGGVQALARQLGTDDWSVGLVGGDVSIALNSISGCGAKRCFVVRGDGFGVSRYTSDIKAAEALVRASGATLVFAPAVSRWTRCLPGLAVRFGGRVDSHATSLLMEDGKVVLGRWYYRQRMEARLSRSTRPWIVLMESGCHQAWEGSGDPLPLEELEVCLGEAEHKTQVKGFHSPPDDERTIRPEAALLFVTGAGWTKKQPDGAVHLEEAESLILGFLRATRASLGSSKSLVDLGSEGQKVLSFLSHLNQVGQTGSTPRHPKGLATCCHGEEPHTVGWRFIHERRAVNLDPNCGWARGKADVLYVADAFAVMAHLNQILARRRAGS